MLIHPPKPGQRLQIAVAQKDLDTAKELLRETIIPEGDLNSALWAAASRGNREKFIDLIMAHGGKVQTLLNGRLNYAAAEGNIPKIDELLEQGADQTDNDYFAIANAIHNSQLEAAKHLKERGSRAYNIHT